MIMTENSVSISAYSQEQCLAPILIHHSSPIFTSISIANALCAAQEFFILNFGCTLIIAQWDSSRMELALGDVETKHLLENSNPADAERLNYILKHTMERFGFITIPTLNFSYKSGFFSYEPTAENED